MHDREGARTGRLERRAGAEDGYAMAALLIGLAIVAVMLTVAMPVWSTATKREKEAELVWRGTQYARAVALFRRKYANASPPNLDILLNERFLRKKYKDPMTKDGEFQLVYATDQQQRAGQIGPGAPPGSSPPGSSQTTPPTSSRPSMSSPPSMSSQSERVGQLSAGARGGIIGVMSKSTEKSLRMFNGRSKYNEWSFTPETVGLRPVGGPGNTPGNVPGGAPGTIGPGGRPGASGPSRGQINLDSGRPGTSGQPGQPRPFGLPPQRPPQ